MCFINIWSIPCLYPLNSSQEMLFSMLLCYKNYRNSCCSTQVHGNIQNTSNFQGTEGSFGLSPIKELFTPKSGDRIRFGYNSERDYVIYDVITPDEDDEGYLKLKLNKILPSNTILDNFVMHRVDNSSIKYIILDVAKDPTVDNPENPFTGIILPKYPSEKLKNNLENILSKLKQEGIIEN